MPDGRTWTIGLAYGVSCYLLAVLLSACSIDSRPYIVKTTVGGQKCYTVDVWHAEQTSGDGTDYRVLCPVEERTE